MLGSANRLAAIGIACVLGAAVWFAWDAAGYAGSGQPTRGRVAFEQTGNSQPPNVEAMAYVGPAPEPVGPDDAEAMVDVGLALLWAQQPQAAIAGNSSSYRFLVITS